MPKKPGKPRRRVLDGRAEAHLVALSCSEPPEGRERWTLRLLALEVPGAPLLLLWSDERLPAFLEVGTRDWSRAGVPTRNPPCVRATHLAAP